MLWCFGAFFDGHNVLQKVLAIIISIGMNFIHERCGVPLPWVSRVRGSTQLGWVEKDIPLKPLGSQGIVKCGSSERGGGKRSEGGKAMKDQIHAVEVV